MGMGWKTVGRDLESSRPCKCGKGKVLCYTVSEESEYPPFDRESTEYSTTCPDNCEKII